MNETVVNFWFGMKVDATRAAEAKSRKINALVI